jgi:hypothetical protein
MLARMIEPRAVQKAGEVSSTDGAGVFEVDGGATPQEKGAAGSFDARPAKRAV